MPIPNHCIDCDKPTSSKNGLCDKCYQILVEESKTTADEYNKEILVNG